MRTDSPTLPPYADIHAHSLQPGADPAQTVLSVDAGDTGATVPRDTVLLSAGIHPWHALTPDWQRLEALLDDERCVALGECGLDRLRGPAMEVQTAVFERQIIMALSRGLPLVIHCVRAWDTLLALRKRHPQGQWIVHGFRGKPALAAQLQRANIDLSSKNGPTRYRESDR